MTAPEAGPGAPTPPIALRDGPAAARSDGQRTEVSAEALQQLGATGAEVLVDPGSTAEASRDWWPLGMILATEGRLMARAAVVVRPHDTDQVVAVIGVCAEHGLPVTPSAGRSGVCGGSVPLAGGVVLDLTLMAGIVSVDATSMVVEVLPGTFGDRFESELQADHKVTCGHWPQSMSLSTVGGWVACRGAGQLSNRYGKIEDLVVGLEVVLADGTVLHTGGHPRQAVGPDLTQLFVGSEGTLGVITRVWLRVHPLAPASRRGAWGFSDWNAAMDVCRRTLQRGATPAVLRLYDPFESNRHFGTGDELNVLIALDEADPTLVDASMAVLAEEVAAVEHETLGDELVEHWLGSRNDVSALEALISKGYVVDTMEVSGRWSVLAKVRDDALAALTALPDTLVASVHQSHAYLDGACLYFTFAALPAEHGPGSVAREAYYRSAWDAAARAALAAGASLSHHHGVGAHRGGYVAAALGDAFGLWRTLKNALDPDGLLNPGKLGLPGPAAWTTSDTDEGGHP